MIWFYYVLLSDSFIRVENLISGVVNLISYLKQQSESPWLGAFEILSIKIVVY